MGSKRNINRAKKDCIFFGEHYFPHLAEEKSAEFHHRLVDIVETPSAGRVSILAPRGHAKSTWLSIIYPIWKIVNDRNITIIIVSDTGEQAEMLCTAIKSELEANERLIKDFEVFKPEAKHGVSFQWQATKLTVMRSKRLKDPTLFSAGTGKRIVGRRADLIILDDPLNDMNTDNDRQRKKTLRWFFKTLTPILHPESGRMIVIGTRKHPDDLHATLGKNRRYEQHVFKALTGDKALWPERWSYKRLLQEKEEIGSVIFAQEYQNEPISEENAHFRSAWIERCYSHTECLLSNYDGPFPVFTGWDLSIVADKSRAEERDSDYTVGISIAVGEDGTRHVIDIFRERGLTPSQVLAAIRERAARYNPARITIENNLFQSLYEQRLIAETDLPVAGHTTGREKMDIYKGVPSLSVHFENGKYRLPFGDDHSRELIECLKAELVGLGIETHDDMVMALWITECGIRRFRSTEGRLEVFNDPTVGGRL